METTFDLIVAEMKSPEVMTPRKVMEYMVWLSAAYAECHGKATEARIARGQYEASLIRDGQTSSAAKALASVSDAGIAELRMCAALKSTEEMIRSLKKAGAFLSEESRNLY